MFTLMHFLKSDVLGSLALEYWFAKTLDIGLPTVWILVNLNLEYIKKLVNNTFNQDSRF